ncbi:MAG: S8 family serine peptidase [Actinomycetota bacterium]|nr:S8 family serine peptidase [Actinomycetota bacterium]MDQ6948867.1 S8 family serine peptidase [Actinomycetota bacterium]
MAVASWQQQVQVIIDGGTGPTRSVILQVRRPDGLGEYLTAAAVALSERRLVQNARECLPPRRGDGGPAFAVAPGAAPSQAGTPPPGTSPLAPSPSNTSPPGSVSARTQAISGAVIAPDAIRQSVAASLDAVLAQGPVRRLLAGATPNQVQRLWAASAIVVEADVAALADLAAAPETVDGLVAIHPNRQLPPPPVVEAQILPAQVAQSHASSWGVARIGALAAWGAYGATGSEAKVGVVDTGVDAAHPDLLRPNGKSKVAGWAEFDGNGQEIPGSVPHDDRGHGTHVCGTIAGGNTTGRWIGVAPAARLYVARVLGPGGGTDAQVLAGLGWAIDQQVDVISMSLGGLTLGPDTPSVFTTALVTALMHGIPVVVAIGNNGAETSDQPGGDLFALSAGATDVLDRVAGFSGGRTQYLTQSDYVDPSQLPLPYSKPELSAPGVAVISAWPGGRHRALDGTSMATPHVSGAIALLLSATNIRDVNPADRPFVLSDLLVGTVEDLGETGQDHRYGFGLINVLNAIGVARELGY